MRHFKIGFTLTNRFDDPNSIKNYDKLFLKMHSAIPYYHPATQSALSVRQQLSPHNPKAY